MKSLQTKPRAGLRAGFTLIEVMIVILIVLALGGLVAFNVMGSKAKADKNMAKIDLQTLEKALKGFHFNHNRYPTDEEGLKVLWDKTAMQDEEEQKKWDKLLDKPIEKDIWGSPWQYKAEGEHGDEGLYDLWSYGPDRQDGTDDDITSWDKEAEKSGSGSTTTRTKGPPG